MKRPTALSVKSGKSFHDNFRQKALHADKVDFRCALRLMDNALATGTRLDDFEGLANMSFNLLNVAVSLVSPRGDSYTLMRP